MCVSSPPEEAPVSQEDAAAAVTATPDGSLPPSEAPAAVQPNKIVEVKDIFKPKVSVEGVARVSLQPLSRRIVHTSPRVLFNTQKQRNSSERTHETYRLLRRKNMIVEAVHNSKIIDSLFQSVGPNRQLSLPLSRCTH